jgi:hypothetical protein
MLEQSAGTLRHITEALEIYFVIKEFFKIKRKGAFFQDFECGYIYPPFK